MIRTLVTLITALLLLACNPKIAEGVRKNDLRKDAEITTSMGVIVVRLSDSTPLHRNNFIKLVHQRFYDSILFHRVIQNFMIQAGDPTSKRAQSGVQLGGGGPSYRIPAEFRPGLFHKKGVIAAAREGDAGNPKKESSGSQFYLVKGRVFTDYSLDSTETHRLQGRKLPEAHRQVYKSIGGTPHLDQNYTVFGEVVSGLEVVDSIAGVATSGKPSDRPLADVRIIKVRMIKRKTRGQ